MMVVSFALVHNLLGLVLVGLLALILGSSAFGLISAVIIGFTILLLGLCYLLTCREYERALIAAPMRELPTDSRASRHLAQQEPVGPNGHRNQEKSAQAISDQSALPAHAVHQTVIVENVVETVAEP